MKNSLKIYNTLNILCVDDDKNVIEIYTSLFCMFFKNVYTAYDGMEGFELFQKESIDIVLTDYSMPLMTGLQMTQKIREVDPSIPIILLTGLENLEILRNAIDLHITGFIKKPISSQSIFSTLEFVAKSVLADRLLMQLQQQKLCYSNYQETLTYQKETTIIKNDLQENKKFLHFTCEVFYQPKDILSGDSYIIRKISDDEYFMFLVDGMGKGISAAVTAMLCSASANNITNQMIKNKNFSLTQVIKQLLEFISPNLLEEEVVCATFLYFSSEERLEYAMFSMPAILCIKDDSNDVIKIKSNNPPLASYTKSVNTTILDTNKISRMLVFSDGLNENSIRNSSEFYGKYLGKDFKEAKDINELEAKRKKQVFEQEDDITYMFIQREELSDI
ncbi:response regulator [Sulfurimonas sp. SWIR-19]|uniref:response regulator n=1 Tax=Sulfurimonas sp. SWIR-19 TaxID=2878390 RepID=UPI001CF4499A|nr:response regulator [Sulfurimonas sp. SWIR-19]UCM99173.1 response regulator [Sulfurimonas sp. SWIR-19]